MIVQSVFCESPNWATVLSISRPNGFNDPPIRFACHPRVLLPLNSGRFSVLGAIRFEREGQTKLIRFWFTSQFFHQSEMQNRKCCASLSKRHRHRRGYRIERLVADVAAGKSSRLQSKRCERGLRSTLLWRWW